MPPVSDRSKSEKNMSATGRPRPLTAVELRQHPEYPHIDWNLTPTKKGVLQVANGRGGPFPLSYEIHGTGPKHLVWVMGLGGMKNAWQRQTKDFGHLKGDEYSCFICDNRGIGDSGAPLQRYTTHGMAQDIIECLDHIGWTAERELHVIGISMGGMISQEIAYLIPERIASLSLVSTASELRNTVGFLENLRNRINLFLPKPIDVQLTGVRYNLFTEDYLDQPDEIEYTKEPFPTNGDRLMAGELSKRDDPKRFPRKGFILQAIAAGWHRKTQKELAELADKVGRERIMVVHGGKDRMITFPHAETLLAGLGGEERGVTKHFEPNQGHVIPIEMRKQFTEWVEELVAKTEAMKTA